MSDGRWLPFGVVFAGLGAAAVAKRGSRVRTGIQVPSGAVYLIFEGSLEVEEPLFWSNDDGWVQFSDATRFNDIDFHTLDLPMGDQNRTPAWTSLDDANSLLERWKDILRREVHGGSNRSNRSRHSKGSKLKTIHAAQPKKNLDDLIRAARYNFSVRRGRDAQKAARRRLFDTARATGRFHLMKEEFPRSLPDFTFTIEDVVGIKNHPAQTRKGVVGTGYPWTQIAQQVVPAGWAWGSQSNFASFMNKKRPNDESVWGLIDDRPAAFSLFIAWLTETYKSLSLSEEASGSPNRGSKLRTIHPKPFPDTELRQLFISHAARMLFVNAWANAMEEAGKSTGPPRTDLMKAAPPTNLESIDRAKEWLFELERANGNRSIDELWAPIEDQVSGQGATIKEFAHDLVMEATGSGVAWSDDHPEHNLDIPHVETYDLAFEYGPQE
jgi:hypothetical protein